jgi:hypothetical protein
MPKAQKQILILFLSLFVFWGCISDVTINTGADNSDLVVNCFLCPQNDTVSVWVSYSKPVQSNSFFEPVKDAQIVLFENNEKVGTLVWADSSLYILPFKVEAGKTYRLEANTETEKIWAETTIPSEVPAIIKREQSTNFAQDFRIELNDNPAEENYYWITATGFEGVEPNRKKNIACSLQSDYEFADDFNRSIYEDGVYKFEYEYYIRFTDQELETDLTNVVFYPQCIDFPIEVFLLSADYHLDKYMKSSLLLYEMDLFAREMPVVYAPFPMYSNISGGTGIFGSYNSVSAKFDWK